MERSSHTDRQTDRQTGRQADSQTETHTEASGRADGPTAAKKLLIYKYAHICIYTFSKCQHAPCQSGICQ